MLLNLSNHPSTGWTGHQRNTALKKFGQIEDIDFPSIDPTLTSDDVRRLAEKYEAVILKMNPSAVHIMGEYTFTHAMVNRLQSIGIPCLVSTTERITHKNPDGSITRGFHFVQFRYYEIKNPIILLVLYFIQHLFVTI